MTDEEKERLAIRFEHLGNSRIRKERNTMNPLELYRHFFPDFTPTCFQQNMIETLAVDEVRWRKTLEYWAGNAYRPQSIQKMFDYYEQLGKTNGTNRNNKRTDADVFAESADFYATYPN